MKRKKDDKISFVDFYSKHGIIPTHQDISDFKKHEQRRRSLYYQLGLPDGIWKGANVLEFGPGSGHNAIITARMNPKSYLLIDANKASIESTKALLKKYAPQSVSKIKQKPILEFRSKEKFGIVLAEGLIPMQKKPLQFLKHISSFVENRGVIVFTTNDAISLLPEILRRWQAWLLCRGIRSFDKKVERLVDFFLPDIKSLKGMSRSPQDWVIDQMIHPWAGPLFSVPEAVKVLKKGWIYLGSSPRMAVDWRWYKKIYGNEFDKKDFLIDDYYSNAHHLLDCRFVTRAIDPNINKQVEYWSLEIYKRVFLQEKGKKPFSAKQLSSLVRKIAKLIQGEIPVTSHALEKFCISISGSKMGSNNIPEFSVLWGRGQQYHSFIKA